MVLRPEQINPYFQARRLGLVWQPGINLADQFSCSEAVLISNQIPWFHEKFCQEEASRPLDKFGLSQHQVDRNRKYQLREDIYQALTDSVGGAR